MKAGWIILAILPIVAFSVQGEDDFFYIADESDQTLLHIAFDAEDDYKENLSDMIEIEDYDTGGLSLAEIDEKDPSLLPWAIDGLESEEISSFIERKTKEITEDFDDVFAYELPTRGYENVYEPTFEKISKERRNLFGKPRVVPAKERKQQSSTHTDQKKLKRPIAAEKGKKLVITAPEKKMRPN